MRIKIINWNILHGFHTTSEPFTFEENRLRLAQQLVKEQNPDILVLTEACYGKEFKGCFIDYPKEFGFPHHYYAPKHYESGVSLLSKFPITKVDNFSHGKVHFLRAQLDLEGKLINLDIVHPHPSLLEEEKARFIRSVLRDFQTPYLLIGDFNACSPHDNYNREEMIRSFSRFEKHPEAFIDSLLTFQMLKEVEKIGLIDAYLATNKDKEVNFTVPTDLLSKDKGSGMRCDFIFCSKDFKVEESGVIKTELTERASDHYPIFSALSLD